MERPDLKRRWIVLLLSSTVLLGVYFCYDNPAALKQPIQDALHLTDTQYNLFYSVYSVPNIVLPLIGGGLVDQFGTRVCLLGFNACIVLGQTLFATGVAVRSFHTALLGRVLFGVGGESLSVVQSTIIVAWFRGKEMALALGCSLTVARLGSVVNDWVCPEIFKAGISFLFAPQSAASAIFVGACLTALTFCAGIALVLLEWRTDQLLRKHRGTLQPEDEPLLLGSGASEKVTEDSALSGIHTIAQFPCAYYIIVFSCMVVYATVLPFNNVAAGVLMAKWHVSLRMADRLMSIPYFVSAIINPFIGGLVDAFGWRAFMVTLAAAVLAIVHLLFAFTLIPAFVPLVLLGTAYSVYAASMWPSIAVVVPENVLGTAFGLTTAVQNGGLATMPIAVGRIKDITGSYMWVEIFFSSVAGFGLFLGVALNVVDYQTGGALNKKQLRVSSEDQGVRVVEES